VPKSAVINSLLARYNLASPTTPETIMLDLFALTQHDTQQAVLPAFFPGNHVLDDGFSGSTIVYAGADNVPNPPKPRLDAGFSIVYVGGDNMPNPPKPK
jgi:thymidylate kinase